MQIIINIPDEAYELLKSKSQLDNIAESIIANGTPLPKGHGDLIDANILRSMYSINQATNRGNFYTVVGIQKWIDDAPTVIAADKSGSEE